MFFSEFDFIVYKNSSSNAFFQSFKDLCRLKKYLLAVAKKYSASDYAKFMAEIDKEIKLRHTERRVTEEIVFV